MHETLRHADVVVGATGLPHAVGSSVPSETLVQNSPVFVNIGHDEFGDAVPDDLVAGGRQVPINFHLDEPTRNYKIDPIQTAEVRAARELVHQAHVYLPGINPLPRSIDQQILSDWIRLWPSEDFSEIQNEIDDVIADS